MTMPHLCNDHDGVMNWDDYDGALEFGENFWHALHVVTIFYHRL
jgi:hypothetical protein